MTSDDQDKNVPSHTFGEEDDNADNASSMSSQESAAEQEEAKIHPSLLKAQQMSMGTQDKTNSTEPSESSNEGTPQIHPSLLGNKPQLSEPVAETAAPRSAEDDSAKEDVSAAQPTRPRTTTVSLKKTENATTLASSVNLGSTVAPSVADGAATVHADDFDDMDDMDDGSYDDLDDEAFDEDLQDEIDAVSSLAGSYDDEAFDAADDVLNEHDDLPKVPAAVARSSSTARLKAMLGGGALLVLLAGGAFVFMGGDDQSTTRAVKVASVADRSYKAARVDDVTEASGLSENDIAMEDTSQMVNDDLSEEAGYGFEDGRPADDDLAEVLPVAEDEEDDVIAAIESELELPETEIAFPEVEDEPELPVSEDVAAFDQQQEDDRFSFDAPIHVATQTDTEVSSQVDVQMFGMDLPQPSAQQNKIGRFEPNKPSKATLTQDFPTDGAPDLPEAEDMPGAISGNDMQIEPLLPTQKVPPKPSNGRTLLSEDNKAGQEPVIDPNEPPVAVLTKPQSTTAETERTASSAKEQVNAVPTSGVIKGTRGGEGGVDNDDEIQAKITEFFDSGSERAGASPFSGIRKVDPSEEPASRFVIVKKRHEASAEEALLVSANRALRLKRYDSALDMFDVLYQKNPRDPRILMGLGVAQQNTGRHDSAFRTYEQVLEVDPKNKEALLNMMGLLKEKYPAVALRRLAEMREAHPDNAQIVAQIGLVSAKIGDYQTAMRNLGIAASLEPKNAMHLYNMAIVADRQREVSNAIKLYQKALEVDSVGGGKALPRDKVYDRLSKLRRRL